MPRRELDLFVVVTRGCGVSRIDLVAAESASHAREVAHRSRRVVVAVFSRKSFFAQIDGWVLPERDANYLLETPIVVYRDRTGAFAIARRFLVFRDLTLLRQLSVPVLSSADIPILHTLLSEAK